MPHPSASTSSPTFIRVSATSSVEVPADKAILQVTLSGTAPTKEGALSTLAGHRDQLTQVLTRFDATVEHVQILSTAVYAERRDQVAPFSLGTEAGFTARTSLRVDIGDVAGISALYNALLGIEPESVRGPYWSLRPGHGAEGIVRRDAVREATARARAMAEAAGSEILRLDWLEDEEPGRRAALSRGAVSGIDEVSLEPAPQTVEASVRGQYQIAPVTYSQARGRS